MTTGSRFVILSAFLSTILAGAGCAGQSTGGEAGDTESGAAITGTVPGSVRVNGTSYNVESEYLPRVVQCENPDAPTESLKAQAIAARTFLTIETQGQSSPSIADGQSAQVFTCAGNKSGAYVSDAVKAAVSATTGQIVLYNGSVTAGFFVAGAERNSSCAQTTDPTNTEKYVTVNVGKSGSAVTTSKLGSSSNPANRGAMGQNLANCIATKNGYTANQILAYFYGEDITVKGSSAPTVVNDSAGDPASSTVGTSGDTSGTNTSGCYSYTTQSQLQLGACVQSTTDNLWYQCDASGNWDPGVADMTGPAGPCTSINS